MNDGKKACPITERRRYPRIKGNTLIFGNQNPGSQKEFKNFTKDISAGGLMFEAEKDISAGTELELEIYQPTRLTKGTCYAMPVLAKVVWTKKIQKERLQKGENKYMIGMEFLEINEENKKRLAQYIGEGKKAR